MEILRISEQWNKLIKYRSHTLLRHVDANDGQYFSSDVPDNRIRALNRGYHAGDEGFYRWMQAGRK
jgi:hypothetical protein